MMFTMTEAAGEYLTTLLDNANAEEEAAIRFVLEGSTLTPTLDHAHPGDATFDHEGRMVLMLDAQVSQILTDSTLDVQATEEGSKLVLLQ
jgi:Fe-S cluster assembly iron-binding protein IscA